MLVRNNVRYSVHSRASAESPRLIYRPTPQRGRAIWRHVHVTVMESYFSHSDPYVQCHQPTVYRARNFLHLTGEENMRPVGLASSLRTLCIHRCFVLSFRGLHISFGFLHFGGENCTWPPQHFVDNQARSLYLSGLCMLGLLDHVKTERTTAY